MAAGTIERTIERTTPIDDTTGTGLGDFGVVVHNNDYNTWDEVISILQVATACPLDEAVMETWEIDNRGRSLVHHGDKQVCERVAKVIRTIGIKVTVEEI